MPDEIILLTCSNYICCIREHLFETHVYEIELVGCDWSAGKALGIHESLQISAAVNQTVGCVK